MRVRVKVRMSACVAMRLDELKILRRPHHTPSPPIVAENVAKRKAAAGDDSADPTLATTTHDEGQQKVAQGHTTLPPATHL